MAAIGTLLLSPDSGRGLGHAGTPTAERLGGSRAPAPDPEVLPGLGGSLSADLLFSGSDSEDDLDSPTAGATELSLVGEGLAVVPPNLAANFPALRRLCLHGNAVASLAGLGGLSGLLDLNLSSNSIAAVPPGALSALGQLTALNLASNCLSALEVGALAGLTRLRRLSLAHNSLASLGGLAALHGGPLERLDVRDNALACLADFSVLAGLPRLAELHVAGGTPGGQAHVQAAEAFAIAAVRLCRIVLCLLPGIRST